MAYGRGIAAPQVGVHKRLVVLQHQGMPLVLINPKFTEKSEEMFTVWDACFQLSRHLVSGPPPPAVKVSYRSELAGSDSGAEGDLAELLQHELEHLDGHLAIDWPIPRVLHHQ